MSEDQITDQDIQEEPKEEKTKPVLVAGQFYYKDQEAFEHSKARTSFDDSFSIYDILGFDLNRRYNATPLNQNTVVITSGNYAYFYDLDSGDKQIIIGHNKGIQCAACHPNGQYVALGETGDSPEILIYKYPNELYRVLKGGTENGFSTIAFNKDGTQLAAVGEFPDFTLTVWDWENETLVLRAKAFSQDVYKVTFSDNLAGRLVTSGLGHIRFWDMARTFTGLKLQGQIGKFGNIEISDTSGFHILPDGKVISGSETGSLLLWEDGLVKCEFIRTGGKKCHKGMIEAVFVKKQDVITGGQDGYIRVWDLTSIDTAETDDTSIPIDLNMKYKLRISKDASIRSMYQIGDQYLVVDQNGGIWKADLQKKTTTEVAKLHSGSVNAVAFSPSNDLLITGGSDSYLRLWVVSEKRLASEHKFESGITRIIWPEGETNTFLVGFSDGCIRVMVISDGELKLKQAVKPHTGAVRDIVIPLTSKLIASTGDDGMLFFFKWEDEILSPVGFVYVNGRKPQTKEEITQERISGKVIQDDKVYAGGVKIRWGNVVSVECSDGTVASVQPPSQIQTHDVESYFLDLPIETLSGGKPDDTISCTFPLEDGEAQGRKDGTITFSGMKRQVHSSPVTAIGFTRDEQWLCTGSENGEIFIFHRTGVPATRVTDVITRSVPVQEVEDIKPGDYSIEEEKQRSELDRRVKAADEKKQDTRRQIEELRKRYSMIVAQNSKAVPFMRLTNDELKIDPFLFDTAEEEAKQAERDASTSTAWEAEKNRVALRKVRERLTPNLEEESFTVRCIKGDVSVSTFRLDKLPFEHDSAGNEEEEQDSREASEVGSHTGTGNGTNSTHDGAETGTESVNGTAELGPLKKKKTLRRTLKDKPIPKIVHEPNEHLKNFQIRQKRLVAINEQKPPANYSDPLDLEAIEVAKNTIGDYKLKDDPNYIAPEEERTTMAKKRRQLMLLLKAINNLKSGFNTKVKGLLELRDQLIKAIEETNRQLEQISLTIGGDGSEMIRIENQRPVEPLPLTQKVDLIVPSPEAVIFAEQVAQAGRRRLEAQAGRQKQAAATTIHRGSNKAAARKAAAVQKKKKKQEEDQCQLSEIEKKEQDELAAEFAYKRDALVRHINEGIEQFDRKVKEMNQEKVRVTTEIENAELRLITMYREYKLLSSLESHDNELTAEMTKSQNDMAVIDKQVKASQDQLKEQDHQLEEHQKELKRLQKKFETLVDTSNKFHDQLQRLYSHNIRRNQNKDADDAEVDITTLDADQVRKMFEAQSIEKEEDSCPQGCDPALFDKVLDLREQKMDVVDAISDIQSQKEKIKAECDQIMINRKRLELTYNTNKQRFDEFQHEKQHQLNDINFSLSLRFHQICNLEIKETHQDEKRAPVLVKQMPANLSDSLIFFVSKLRQLAQQEQNLKAERVALVQKEKADVQRYRDDEKEKEKLDSMLAERAKKLEGIQQLKFGQNVDLVNLEQMRINTEADTLKEQIREVEAKQHKEMTAMMAQIDAANAAMTQEVQRNTSVLGCLAQLTEQQRDIETVLQDSRKMQTADDLNSNLELADPNEIVQEVQRNNELIEKLEEEVNMLKRK